MRMTLTAGLPNVVTAVRESDRAAQEPKHKSICICIGRNVSDVRLV